MKIDKLIENIKNYDELLAIKEYADLKNIPLRTVYSYIYKGKLPFIELYCTKYILYKK